MADTSSDTSDAHAAIDELIAAHGGTLYNLGLKICRSPEVAEELVQETFLNAFRKWDSFEGRSQPKTWLYTIARRACQRLQRPRAGEPETLEPLESLLPKPGETLGTLEESGPYREHLVREAQATVDRALGELPLGFRMPLVLVDIAEFSIAETAAILDLEPGTVKSRLHRGRLKLRQIIDRCLPQKVQPVQQPSAVCLSLLQAKQEALDREVPFPYADSALCERCKAVFAALDLGQEACRVIGKGALPGQLRDRLEAALRAEA